MPNLPFSDLRTARIAAVLTAAVLLAACSGNMTGAATPPISQQSVTSGSGTYTQGGMSAGLGATASPTPAGAANSEVTVDLDPTPVSLPVLNGVGGTLVFLQKPSAAPGSPALGSPAPNSRASGSASPSGSSSSLPSPSTSTSPAATASGMPTATAPVASPHAQAASANANPNVSMSPGQVDPAASPAEIGAQSGASPAPSASSAADGTTGSDHQAILAIGLRLTPTDAPSRESKTTVLATQPVVAVHIAASDGDAVLAGLHGITLTMPENAFTASVHTALAIYETNHGKKKKKAAPTLLAIDEKATFSKGTLKAAPTTPIRLRSGHSYEIVLFADQALIVNPLASATATAAAGATGSAGTNTAPMATAPSAASVSGAGAAVPYSTPFSGGSGASPSP